MMQPVLNPKSSPQFEHSGDCVLALDCQALIDAAGPLPVSGAVHRRFADLGADLLAELKPVQVIMPLFAQGYDAMTAIEELERLQFTGRITVIAPKLPRPRLVERELRSLGPGLRLALISPN